MSIISIIGRVAVITVGGVALSDGLLRTGNTIERTATRAARFTSKVARQLCNHAQEINAEKMDALHRWQVRRRAARITREMQLNLEALAYLQDKE